MSRQRPRWVLLVVTILSFGCGFHPGGFTGPPVPEYRQPTDADIEQLTQRMMGKAPKREVPVSTDDVQVVFQTGHAGGIRTLALSPNGRYIASSGGDATVKIWDVASGQEVRTLTGYDMLGADTLAFSPDSTRIITAEMGSGVKVIEVATGREVLTVGSLTTAGAAVSAALIAIEPDPAKRVGRVFKRKNGEDWGQMRTAFEKAVERAGLQDFRFHDLRHTAASHLAMRGRPLKEIQEVLGHKSFSMTLRYAHLSPKHLRTAVESLAGLTPELSPSTDSWTHKWTHSVKSAPESEDTTPQVVEIERLRP